MIEGRVGRFLLLVVPVLFGLLAMHALVVPAVGDAAPAAVGHGTAVHGTASHGTAGPLGTQVADPARPGGPGGGPHAAAAVVGAGAALPGGGGTSGHHGVDHLVHLCLAVLAAVGIAVAVAWVLLGPVASPLVAGLSARRVRPVPAGRPPPVPRRLARLCVLRN